MPLVHDLNVFVLCGDIIISMTKEYFSGERLVDRRCLEAIQRMMETDSCWWLLDTPTWRESLRIPSENGFNTSRLSYQVIIIVVLLANCPYEGRSVTLCLASVSVYRHTSWNTAVLGIAVSSVEGGYVMVGRVARSGCIADSH